jgi:hypothetical protein
MSKLFFMSPVRRHGKSQLKFAIEQYAKLRGKANPVPNPNTGEIFGLQANKILVDDLQSNNQHE